MDHTRYTKEQLQHFRDKAMRTRLENKARQEIELDEDGDDPLEVGFAMLAQGEDEEDAGPQQSEEDSWQERMYEAHKKSERNSER